MTMMHAEFCVKRPSGVGVVTDTQTDTHTHRDTQRHTDTQTDRQNEKVLSPSALRTQ